MARETYLALLRGINVGGNNIIPMAALARTFEAMKLSAVKTYIASGNVIFGAPKADPRKLEVSIEKALEKAFEYDAKVVVKSRLEMAAIVDGMPKDWRRPSAAMRYYVLFLRHAVDSKRILDQLEPRAGVETLTYVPGALLWAAKRSEITRSRIAKQMLAKPIYQEITARNLNTTSKLAQLIAAHEP